RSSSHPAPPHTTMPDMSRETMVTPSTEVSEGSGELSSGFRGSLIPSLRNIAGCRGHPHNRGRVLGSVPCHTHHVLSCRDSRPEATLGSGSTCKVLDVASTRT